MPVYHKLVRDKILEMIAADGLTYHATVLEPSELLVKVKAKMLEEATEFQNADRVQDNVEELADIVELVHTALRALNVSYQELEAIRQQKKEKRGGFEKAIYLLDVEDR